MGIPRRIALEVRGDELAEILREFAKLGEPGESISDRAVRVAIPGGDAGVLLPPVDFERAVENEELLEELMLELATAERLADRPRRWMSVENVACELGLASELGLDSPD